MAVNAENLKDAKASEARTFTPFPRLLGVFLVNRPFWTSFVFGFCKVLQFTCQRFTRDFHTVLQGGGAAVPVSPAWLGLRG